MSMNIGLIIMAVMNGGVSGPASSPNPKGATTKKSGGTHTKKPRKGTIGPKEPMEPSISNISSQNVNPETNDDRSIFASKYLHSTGEIRKLIAEIKENPAAWSEEDKKFLLDYLDQRVENTIALMNNPELAENISRQYDFVYISAEQCDYAELLLAYIDLKMLFAASERETVASLKDVLKIATDINDEALSRTIIEFSVDMIYSSKLSRSAKDDLFDFFYDNASATSPQLILHWARLLVKNDRTSDFKRIAARLSDRLDLSVEEGNGSKSELAAVIIAVQLLNPYANKDKIFVNLLDEIQAAGLNREQLVEFYSELIPQIEFIPLHKDYFNWLVSRSMDESAVAFLEAFDAILNDLPPSGLAKKPDVPDRVQELINQSSSPFETGEIKHRRPKRKKHVPYRPEMKSTTLPKHEEPPVNGREVIKADPAIFDDKSLFDLKQRASDDDKTFLVRFIEENTLRNFKEIVLSDSAIDGLMSDTLGHLENLFEEAINLSDRDLQLKTVTFGLQLLLLALNSKYDSEDMRASHVEDLKDQFLYYLESIKLEEDYVLAMLDYISEAYVTCDGDSLGARVYYLLISKLMKEMDVFKQHALAIKLYNATLTQENKIEPTMLLVSQASASLANEENFKFMDLVSFYKPVCFFFANYDSFPKNVRLVVLSRFLPVAYERSGEKFWDEDFTGVNLSEKERAEVYENFNFIYELMKGAAREPWLYLNKRPSVYHIDYWTGIAKKQNFPVKEFSWDVEKDW